MAAEAAAAAAAAALSLICWNVVLTDLNVAQCSEPHLSGDTSAGGQQGRTHPLQRCLADGRQAAAKAEEEAEGGGHDQRVRADQQLVQQRQDVEELVV